jgi:hypothetical protein
VHKTNEKKKKKMIIMKRQTFNARLVLNLKIAHIPVDTICELAKSEPRCGLARDT